MLTDAVRLAFGTLTILPVRPPGTVDRATGSWAMVLAPLVGLVLGLVAALPLPLVDPRPASPLLASALVVALTAGLTRAMHLDGLADTADGLGSGKPAGEALEIMRRSDIGPFGVVTLLLTLLVQVAALAQLVGAGRGALAITFGVIVSRLVLPVICSRGIPAARPDGLGQVVAGSVGRVQLLGAVVLALLAMLLCGVLAHFVLGTPGEDALRLAFAAPVGLLVGGLLCWRCVRRFGGVTGDVLGGCIEATFAASLVAMVLAA